MIRGLKNLINYADNHPRVSKLDVGQGGWKTPWSFKMTKKGEIYVMDSDLEPTGGGTLEVYIEKTKEGYDVDFTKVSDHGIDVCDDESEFNECIVGNPEWVCVGTIKDDPELTIGANGQ